VTTRGSTHVRTAFMGLTSSRGVTASGTLLTRTRPRSWRARPSGF
jgi:hypothetical protein